MNSSLISKSMPILSVDLSAKSSAVNPNWLLTGFRSSIDSDKFDTNWRNLWAFWHRSANVLILLSSEKQWLQIHISFVNSCNENYRIRKRKNVWFFNHKPNSLISRSLPILRHFRAESTHPDHLHIACTIFQRNTFCVKNSISTKFPIFFVIVV